MIKITFKRLLFLFALSFVICDCLGGGVVDDEIIDGGGDKPDSRIDISTAQELDAIRNDLAGDYKLIADIDLSTFGNWTPIGNEGAAFTGKIDGNGYKIEGLELAGVLDEAGFFGRIDGAEINNLALENVNIGALGSESVGALAGRAINSQINNSYSTGSISAMSSNPLIFVGGLVGELDDSAINSSYTIISFTFSVGGDNEISGNIGGIVGTAYGSEINNSYSNASIDDSTDDDKTYITVGGIVGYAGDSSSDITIITNCYSLGKIKSSGDGGGIAGDVWADEGGQLHSNVAIVTSIEAKRAARISYSNAPGSTNNLALSTMRATDAAFPDDDEEYKNGLSKTESELKSQATYEAIGWKFGNDDANPWKMPENGGYPILYWE